MKQVCLMLGAGHTKMERKFVAPNSASEEDTEWVSLDMNPDCKPKILFELDLIEKEQPIPVPDCMFDEIHAYDVLEHYGQQGDFKGFFRGFNELWRILKPNGLLIGNTPMWNAMWAWSDPGHRRIISEGTLSYLQKSAYENLGKDPRTDYRRYIKGWWKLLTYGERHREDGVTTGGFFFALQKVT